MKPLDELEWHKKLRCITANRTDNIYELTRMRIVRVVREYEGDVEWAAEKLGCSRSTVRRYMNFVPFEHLMRDPSLENRFDWRSMTERKWERLLQKHPCFISRLPKKRFPCLGFVDILIAQPQLAPHFDLSELNRLELNFAWSQLLSRRPWSVH